jgi:cephalosporin hydroxylase
MSYQDIDGWFNFEDLYAEMVKTARPDDVLVEVGVWCGKSVVYLAQQAVQSGKALRIFAVDTWLGSARCPERPDLAAFSKNGKLWRTFLENLRREGVNHVVTPMCLPSVQAASYFEDQSVYMVFIDAEHTYAAVKADLAAWRPKVRPGGWLAGHDWESDEVKSAVREVGNPVLRRACWMMQM